MSDDNDGQVIATHTSGDGTVQVIEETVTELVFNPTTNQIEYIDENGDLNLVDLGDLISEVDDLNDGKVIATHTSGDGTVTDIEETVTDITIDYTTNAITYTDENGDPTVPVSYTHLTLPTTPYV